MRFTKKQAEFCHSFKRVKERYELELNKTEIKEIISLIQSNQAEFVIKESNRVSHFRVPYKDKKLYVVYDRKRHMTITFLPEVLKENHIENIINKRKENQKNTFNDPNYKPKVDEDNILLDGFLPEKWKVG